MQNSKPESAAVVATKFFASCLLGFGVLSFVWAQYTCAFYSIAVNAAMYRICGTLAIVAVGSIALALLPMKKVVQSGSNILISNSSYRFIIGRIDGIMMFLSIPAIVGLLILLPTAINSLLNTVPSNLKFDPVKVQIDSMEIKHVPEEKVGEEHILKVYYLPGNYIDLWLACGKGTLLEVKGAAIEPQACNVTFSVPKTDSSGTRRSYRKYISHHKSDAKRDSECYRVGKVYSGWILRETPEAGVVFIRPADKLSKEVLLLVALLVSVCMYLGLRMVIGRKIQDPHWTALVEIWTK